MGIFRLLLAVCVLFGHAVPFGPLHYLSGIFAVEAFFVISGFYMALVLTEKYTPEELGTGWIRRFYGARYLRLYPAYLVSLVSLLLVYGLAARLFHSEAGPLLAWQALLALPHTAGNLLLLAWAWVSNLSIFLQDLGGVLAVRDGHAVFTAHRMVTEVYAWALTVNGVTWSLGVELTFYACAPFLIKLSNRQLFLLVLLGLALKICAVSWLEDDLPYRMTPFVFANFILGMLAYRKRAVLVAVLGRYTPWAAYGLMLLLTVALPNGLTQWAYSLLAVALTALIVPSLFHSSKRSALDNRLGEMSYPFYLFHITVITVLHFALTKRLGISNAYFISICNVLGTVIFSQLVLALENRYIEPYRQRLGRPAIPA